MYSFLSFSFFVVWLFFARFTMQTRKEGMWCEMLLNSLLRGESIKSSHQLPMCQVLDDNASTARTCTVALEGLENFLNFGEKLKTVSNHELQLFSNSCAFSSAASETRHPKACRDFLTTSWSCNSHVALLTDPLIHTNGTTHRNELQLARV